MKRALAAAAVLALGARRARLCDGESPRHTALVHVALSVAAAPYLAAESSRERSRLVFWGLLGAQQLRTCVALVHDRLMTTEYAGSTDTEEYHLAGTRLAAELRALRLRQAGVLMRTVPWDTRLPGPVSTNLMRLLTGLTYAAIGPSRRSSTVVFSWLGFCGLMLFRKAFLIAVPEGSDRAYSMLLFLHPSLAFWTSGIAKEPWMTFGFGTCALGLARTLKGSPRSGLPLAALGLGAAAAMRVQVGGRHGMTIGSELRGAGDRSHIGRSRFTPPRFDSIQDAPRVAASVLFRPLPSEGHNLQARAAALEGSLLFLLTLARARWITAAVASVPRNPYIAFALGATGVVIAYLAPLANLGMLVRQRTPIIPFYLVILSVPPRSG